MKWKGFSEKVFLEVRTGAPTLHRRIVFETALDLEVFPVVKLPGAPSPGAQSEWGRLAGERLTKQQPSQWACSLFQDPSTDGVITGKLKPEIGRVLEDKLKKHGGKEDGDVLRLKFWNGFDKQIKYSEDGNGGFTSMAAAHSTTKNLYILDLWRNGFPRPVSLRPTLAPSVSAGSTGSEGSRTSSGGARGLKNERGARASTPSDSFSEMDLDDSPMKGDIGLSMRSEMSFYWHTL